MLLFKFLIISMRKIKTFLFLELEYCYNSLNPNTNVNKLQACGAVFFNKGENCIAAGRLFVEDSIHDEFLARVVI